MFIAHIQDFQELSVESLDEAVYLWVFVKSNFTFTRHDRFRHLCQAVSYYGLGVVLKHRLSLCFNNLGRDSPPTVAALSIILTEPQTMEVTCGLEPTNASTELDAPTSLDVIPLIFCERGCGF